MLPSIPLISGAVTTLCVVALPLWILGVPGDPGEPGRESNYACGWQMGLSAITVYPIVWALNFLPYFALRGLFSPQTQASWQNISQWISAIALIAVIIRVIWAFRVLSRG